MNTQDWDLAFASALRLSLKDYRDHIETESDHLLAETPERIGFTLIKKPKGTAIGNAVGSMFSVHNIIEYISPEEDLNLDVIYRCIGYAGLYKGFPPEDVTISEQELSITIFTDAIPYGFKDMFGDASNLENIYSGIYYVKNIISIPIQIVITSMIEVPDFLPLQLLSKSLKEEALRDFLGQVKDYIEEGFKQEVHTVVSAAMSLNRQLFVSLKEDKAMSSVFKEIFSEELEQGIAKGRALGRVEGRNEGQKALIAVIRDLKSGCTEAEILSKGYDANTLALGKSIL